DLMDRLGELLALLRREVGPHRLSTAEQLVDGLLGAPPTARGPPLVELRHLLQRKPEHHVLGPLRVGVLAPLRALFLRHRFALPRNRSALLSRALRRARFFPPGGPGRSALGPSASSSFRPSPHAPSPSTTASGRVASLVAEPLYGPLSLAGDGGLIKAPASRHFRNSGGRIRTLELQKRSAGSGGFASRHPPPRKRGPGRTAEPPETMACSAAVILTRMGHQVAVAVGHGSLVIVGHRIAVAVGHRVAPVVGREVDARKLGPCRLDARRGALVARLGARREEVGD